MNGYQLLQCGLSVAALLGGSALAASPAVYPVPQLSNLSSKTVAFSGKPSVVIRSAKTAASKSAKDATEAAGATDDGVAAPKAKKAPAKKRSTTPKTS